MGAISIPVAISLGRDIAKWVKRRRARKRKQREELMGIKGSEWLDIMINLRTAGKLYPRAKARLKELQKDPQMKAAFQTLKDDPILSAFIESGEAVLEDVRD